MEMTLRWYGSKFDTVTLEQIRQIPGVHGVITTLYDTEPGEVWSRERIRALKDEVEASGLAIAGIESVNVHEDIKLGKPIRDKWTEWERAHPEQPWRPVKETPEMKELQKIVDKLRPTVQQLCPGI